MPAMNPVWDLALYLGCVQLFLLATAWRLAGSAADETRPVRTAWLFGAALVVFWLVWGGYSVDAWRYLSRFDRNPMDFLEEQLFWLLGFSLGSVLPDPWPLKVVSGLFAATMAVAYGWLYRESDWRLPLGCMLLLATPGFVLLGGNAVRQGMAGAIGIVAAVWMVRAAGWRWILLLIPAFLVHQFSVVLFAALVVVRFARRYLPWFWLLAFFVSPLAREAAELAGFSLDHRIAYATYAEGQFHWAKLVVSALLSLLVLGSVLVRKSDTVDFRHIYLALASCSHALLIYEVPFERLLLFADLAAPAALVQVLWLHGWRSPTAVGAAALLTLTGSLILWNTHSIVLSLGLF